MGAARTFPPAAVCLCALSRPVPGHTGQASATLDGAAHDSARCLLQGLALDEETYVAGLPALLDATGLFRAHGQPTQPGRPPPPCRRRPVAAGPR